MNQVEAMQVFVRVAERASFTQAALSLGLPKASISNAVQQLESHLGVRLLHRTTRRVQMTQDGQAFYDRCTAVLADLDELQSMFRRQPQELRGRLRIDMSTGLAREHVIPRLPEFLERHPLLELEISCTDRRVDLVGEGFDCVVRAGPVADGSLVARPLGAMRMVNCASPAYLARHGTPTSLDELPQHRLVHYVGTLGAKPTGFDVQAADGVRSLPMPGAITVDNIVAYQAACLAGLGLIQAPRAGLEPLLRSGRLVEVLAAYPPPPLPLHLLVPHRRHLSRRLQALMNWLGEVVEPLVA